MLKNRRDLFDEFKVHRLGRRAPQGNERYRPWCTTSIMLAVTSRSPGGLILVIEVGAIARSVLRQPVRGR